MRDWAGRGKESDSGSGDLAVILMNRSTRYTENKGDLCPHRKVESAVEFLDTLPFSIPRKCSAVSRFRAIGEVKVSEFCRGRFASSMTERYDIHRPAAVTELNGRQFS